MLSKFFLFTSLAHLFDASLRIIFINFLQNFHHVTPPLPLSFPNPEYNKMTNITPNAWQQISASNFTNFLFSAVQLVPGKKGREGGKNSRDECPSPTSRRADHGTMKWSSRHVLVTALLRTSDITISLWLMQTFVQIAGNVLSHPSPLPPLSVVPTNASYAVHTCARRCNERVCKCVCHDYTSSSSVCNCSPFVPPSGEEAKSGVALERDSLWILLDAEAEGIKTGTRDLLSRFLASII